MWVILPLFLCAAILLHMYGQRDYRALAGKGRKER